MFKTFLLGFILVNNLTLLAGHDLRFYDFYSDNRDRCLIEGKSAAEILSENGVRAVYSHDCDYDRWTNSLTLILHSESNLKPQLTSNFSLRSYENRGFYKSLEECSQKIEWEAERFRSMTGLAALIQYCARQRGVSSDRWYVQLHALGSSQVKHMLSSWDTGRPHGEPQQDIIAELANNFSRFDITLNNIRFRRQPILGKATVSLYVDASLDWLVIDSNVISREKGIENCLSKRDELRRIMLSYPLETGFLAAYCSSNYSSPKAFELTLVRLPKSRLRFDYSKEAFQTREACERALEDSEGSREVGQFCSSKPYSNEALEEKYRIFKVLVD